MVVIRLSRTGAKKRPFYHIVVADKRRSLTGRFIQQIGYYNPIAAGKEIKLKFDVALAEEWISKGAQPSDRVVTLLKMAKEQATQAA